MTDFDDVTRENTTRYNQNFPFISDHSYIIFIIGSSRSGKTNVLLNLISHQPDIEKRYLVVKDPY